MSRKSLLIRLAAMSAAVAAGSAHAVTTVDTSGVLANIDATSVVASIVAVGAIYALPGFAKWSVKKVAGFFG
ncbi:hypothetical protein BKK81_10490 [Cupriavidus sp. USMAHM13]|uniref:hypothetical protein n=1 Tax=Cupriavidus sp. USMAHM13 TaxID=1389192 RepID=UPI0008A6CC78|nr:hypothetical protein [Cupriavidus sp. USMAHM13]AOY99635.1 hypothetical protein BKK81_10490 [Cupriavidus sp. USMAHM13]